MISICLWFFYCFNFFLFFLFFIIYFVLFGPWNLLCNFSPHFFLTFPPTLPNSGSRPCHNYAGRNLGWSAGSAICLGGMPSVVATSGGGPTHLLARFVVEHQPSVPVPKELKECPRCKWNGAANFTRLRSSRASGVFGLCPLISR